MNKQAKSTRLPIVWIASYPRSGNTFFRNILFHVFGIESEVYSFKHKIHIDRASILYIKTHLIPQQLPIEKEDIVIYLIRDGRDSVLSRAYKKKQIHKRFSSFRINLLNFISHKNSKESWSSHLKAWEEYVTLTIKFEELTKDPIKQIEQLSKSLSLPSPNLDELPTFETQKNGNSKYSGGGNSKAFFRKGKVGGWKKEFPNRYMLYFHYVHGDKLHELGYLDEIPTFNNIQRLTLFLTRCEAKVFRTIEFMYFRPLNKFLGSKKSR
ncbi:sulfotransferase domain-containing protein [Ekhidna sp. MALMAid0563]|uniref:sulfotransferase domain-containing protein n=1 Tax=Ekhidna sp. MALMAid0563 TaxID=3143937 RepID=UPI0032DFB484